MAVLTKKRIVEYIQDGKLVFTPELDKFQLQGHSVDLRLGFTFIIPQKWHVTKKGRESLEVSHFDKPRQEHFTVVELEKGQHFELLPQEYITASTLETIKVPGDLMGVLYPRSSTNRKGLSLDLTGIIDSGYEGQLVIPLRNNTQSQIVRLYPGERLCQVVFEELSNTIVNKKSKYHRKDVIEGFGREKRSEANIIMRGNIHELKEKYPVIRKKPKK